MKYVLFWLLVAAIVWLIYDDNDDNFSGSSGRWAI